MPTPVPSLPADPSSRRPVRWLDVDARDLAGLANGIEDMYDDALDVILVRGAFDAATLAEAGAWLDADTHALDWSRPNAKMPVEDLQLLGTDNPATPTFQAPLGASLEAYLGSAARHARAAAAVFKPDFDASAEIRAALSRFSGGRPVEVPRASDGRSYVPFTIRRLVDGKQIGIHHDYHYRLELYRELSERLDTRTLISHVATLRAPQEGGELFVYGATSDAGDLPKLPNGYAYDLPAIEARYDCARFVTKAGDLFLLAAGRCLHRVGRVGGPQARITMGGFLALDKALERVLFWS
ncbi:2OG-Fe(II)-dependent halogenase WelO5 family protein [Paucibacter soli]|uniref:2OG-Fe(II)-dependent halogenase WelO5 family protein n=1 Tax=Paucibacter soli TaxID=3133433 RepID=UPI0030961FB5